MDNFKVEGEYALIFEVDRMGMQHSRPAQDVKPE